MNNHTPFLVVKYRLANMQGGIFVLKGVIYGNERTEKQKVQEITEKLEQGIKELSEHHVKIS